MKIKIIKILIILLLYIPHLYCQSVNWVNEIKSYNYEQLQGLRVTQQGESFITGYIDGSSSTSFGNITVPYNINLLKNYFIAKCDQNGNFVWVKTGGGWSYNIGNSVDFDEKGNIYTTGTCTGDARFDNILLPAQQYPGMTFLIKYNEAGNIQWAKRFNSYGNDYGGGACLRYLNGYLYDFATSSTGNGIVIFDTTLNINGDIIYVTKFDTLGNFIFAKKIAVSNGLMLREAITLDNDFIITGFANSWNVIVDTVKIQLPRPKHQSFIARYDPNLNMVWAKKFSSTNCESFVLALDIDDDKNILATGTYYDTLTVDGQMLINSSSVNAKSFVCKLDPSGNLLWIKDINGLGYLANIGISHYKNRIYLLGYFYGYLLTDAVYLESPFEINVSILEFDTNGNAIQGESLGSQDKYIQSNNIGIDANGSFYITGQYLDHAKLQNYFLYADSLYSQGVEDWANTTDGFIFKYQPSILNLVQDFSINQNEISIYPNPNDGKFTVSSRNIICKGTIEVFNVLGEIIFKKEIRSQSEMIELKNVSPGTYFLKMNDSKKHLTKIFIVQN